MHKAFLAEGGNEMNVRTEILCEVAELLALSVDGSIEADQFERLENLLQNDSLAREYYYDLLLTTAALNEVQAIPGREAMEVANEEFDERLWQALAESEKTSPRVYCLPAEQERETVELAAVEKPKAALSKFSIYALAVSAAAALLVAATFLLPPPRPVVATITDCIQTEWINTKTEFAPGDRLRQGEYFLARGFTEITFEDGAIAVIEAPAAFKLDSSASMFLTSGKMTAAVSAYATGFTVHTFSGSIVDLGTEFGVSVDGDGSCNVHMFTGRANVIAGAKKTKRTNQIVNASKAINVNSTTGQIRSVQLNEQAFVRHINSNRAFKWRGENLNLADIIGGQDGFGVPQAERGIDPITGEAHNRILRKERAGTGEYVPVPAIRYVDGVFSLSEKTGLVTVSSAGHEFSGFEQNAGRFWTDITTGGSSRNSILNGTVYGVGEQPYIYIRPNVGITFDLERIREDLSNFRITEFLARVGCSENSQGTSVSHFWVLVDGQLRWKSDAVTRETGGVDVSVELGPQDRFMTLATTDGGDGWKDDWCFFANPELKIALQLSE